MLTDYEIDYNNLTEKTAMTSAGNIAETKVVILGAADSDSHLKVTTVNENDELEGINDFISDISNAFFSPKSLQAKLELNLKRYTGSPFILASRIRPTSYEDTLLLDIYCDFQWSNKEPMLISIAIFTNLDPIFPQVAPDLNESQAADPLKYKKPNRLGRIKRFFSPHKATFQTLLQKAKVIEGGIDEKENAYLLALKGAQTSQEIVLALECLINVLNAFYEYTGKQYAFDLETCQRKQAEVLAKINTHIEQLPANYLSITPSAIQIQQKFMTILELLSDHHNNHANNVEDAWSVFSSMPPLTAFIKYAFPNLVAMWHQLNGVFNIIIVDGYRIRTIEMSAPEEEEIKRDQLNSLYIHMVNGSICCSVKDRMGEVDRFIIRDLELGEHGAEIRELLERNRGLFSVSDNLKDQLYRTTARKGRYYPSTKNSIPAALADFSNVYALLKQYQPAQANRLQKATIEPLQTIMLTAEEVNKTTPDAVKRSIAIPEQEEIQSQLLRGEKIIDRPTFDTSHWESLLNLHCNNQDGENLTCPL